MTLLLVDDQINVINGLMNGINYRKLEIDTVLPSTSVQEAKTLICENHRPRSLQGGNQACKMHYPHRRNYSFCQCDSAQQCFLLKISVR